MEHENKDVKGHLDSAKEELKHAATGTAEHAKDKVGEVVDKVATSIGEAADKVREEVQKEEPVAK